MANTEKHLHKSLLRLVLLVGEQCWSEHKKYTGELCGLVVVYATANL